MYNAIQIFSLHFLIMVNCKQEKKGWTTVTFLNLHKKFMNISMFLEQYVTK